MKTTKKSPNLGANSFAYPIMPFNLKFLLKEFVHNVIEELCLCRNGGGGGGGGGGGRNWGRGEGV